MKPDRNDGEPDWHKELVAEEQRAWQAPGVMLAWTAMSRDTRILAKGHHGLKKWWPPLRGAKP